MGDMGVDSDEEMDEGGEALRRSCLYGSIGVSFNTLNIEAEGWDRRELTYI
jgi:hypothetical protein